MDPDVKRGLERIIDISFRNKLSHLSSTLTMLPILVGIYKKKRPSDIVVLSAGHAGLAQYVCIEMFERDVETGDVIDAELMFKDHGVHPGRDVRRHIHASSGSLGCAITIAIGIALAKSEHDVYCIMSDGECAEGSVWESLAFIQKQSVSNIHVHVNANGFAAYEPVDPTNLERRLQAFLPAVVVHHTRNPEGLEGLRGHYHVMKSLQDVVLPG
jgi:transketolase